MSVKETEKALRRARQTVKRNQFEADEDFTRKEVVDPILVALGWRKYGPEWETERSTNEGRVDYSLLDSSGTPAILIEAKRLDRSITVGYERLHLDPGPRDQLFDYVSGQTKGIGVLTNGWEWHFWDLSGRKRKGRPLVKDVTSIYLFNPRTFWEGKPRPLQPGDRGEISQIAVTMFEWLNASRWRPQEPQPELFTLQ